MLFSWLDKDNRPGLTIPVHCRDFICAQMYKYKQIFGQDNRDDFKPTYDYFNLCVITRLSLDKLQKRVDIVNSFNEYLKLTNDEGLIKIIEMNEEVCPDNDHNFKAYRLTGSCGWQSSAPMLSCVTCVIKYDRDKAYCMDFLKAYKKYSTEDCKIIKKRFTQNIGGWAELYGMQGFMYRVGAQGYDQHNLHPIE